MLQYKEDLEKRKSSSNQNLASTVDKIQNIPSTGDKVQNIPSAVDKVENIASSSNNIENITSTADKVQNIPSTVDKVESTASALDKVKYPTFLSEVEWKLHDLKAKLEQADHVAENLLSLHRNTNIEDPSARSHDREIAKVKANTIEKLAQLDKDYPENTKSVDYYNQVLDIQSSLFKKVIALKQKHEQSLYEGPSGERLRQIDGYDDARSGYVNRIIEGVKSSRLEKKELRDFMYSNVEKPMDLASNLIDETSGPADIGEDF